MVRYNPEFLGCFQIRKITPRVMQETALLVGSFTIDMTRPRVRFNKMHTRTRSFLQENTLRGVPFPPQITLLVVCFSIELTRPCGRFDRTRACLPIGLVHFYRKTPSEECRLSPDQKYHFLKNTDLQQGDFFHLQKQPKDHGIFLQIFKQGYFLEPFDLAN